MQHVAQRNGWTLFISTHDQYNLINRGEELEMFGLLADHSVVTRPWADRTTNRGARGTDRFGRPLWLDTDQAIIDAIQRIAEARRVSMAQVALAWVLKNPVVDAPIVGVTKQHTWSTPPPRSTWSSPTTRSPRSRSRMYCARRLVLTGPCAGAACT